MGFATNGLNRKRQDLIDCAIIQAEPTHRDKMRVESSRRVHFSSPAERVASKGFTLLE